jgi:6-phosphofructokinase
LHPTFKNTAKTFVSVMGAAASFVALKSEYKDLTKESIFQELQAKLTEIKGSLQSARKELQQVKSTQAQINYSNKLHIKSIEMNLEIYHQNFKHESELQKELQAQKIN